MRVRVIRWTDPVSSWTTLAVQCWSAGKWEHALNFELSQVKQANEFAMELSMKKEVPVEMAMFEDGQKLSGEPA